MQIIDLTNPAPKKSKPIELISCLQDSRTKTPDIPNDIKKSFYFYEFEEARPVNKNTEKLVRLITIKLVDGEYDIIAKYYRGDAYPRIFLGHWNDGWVAGTTE